MHMHVLQQQINISDLIELFLTTLIFVFLVFVLVISLKFMYRKQIVSEGAYTTSIPKEVFWEMNKKISHLEQAQNDHEFLKYEFEKKKEEINSLQEEIKEQKSKSRPAISLYDELKVFTENMNLT